MAHRECHDCMALLPRLKHQVERTGILKGLDIKCTFLECHGGILMLHLQAGLLTEDGDSHFTFSTASSGFSSRALSLSSTVRPSCTVPPKPVAWQNILHSSACPFADACLVTESTCPSPMLNAIQEKQPTSENVSRSRMQRF